MMGNQVGRANKIISERSDTFEWVSVCSLSDILPNTGVAAQVRGQQIAIFRLDDDALFALSNYDPFSHANVIARGIVGCHKGEPKVASPIYKQTFSLRTGVCFEDPRCRLNSYGTRVRAGQIEVCVEIT